MSSSSPFKYPESLQSYMITEQQYFKQNPDFSHVCTGAVVYNADGKMLLVQRAKEEHSFPNAWEIPGGKVDLTDETLLHAAARELKEESGLAVNSFVRKVGQFSFGESSQKPGAHSWCKLVFEVDVEGLDVTLDPVEHQAYLWATEEEVRKDRVGEVGLLWISFASKRVILDAFRLAREQGRGGAANL